MLSSDLPDDDVVEVSIFGPGKGESVLVHLGNRKWIIVDSCIDVQSDSIPGIDYLRRLGVSISTDVVMILGTHAHDDHIAGIARALEECKSAFFACSTALTKEEFAAVLEEDLEAELSLRQSSYSEYRAIHKIVDARRKEAGGQKRFLKRAIEDLPLIKMDWTTVTALSPSNEAITRSLRKLANITAVAVKGQPRRLSVADPNEFSIALWVEALDKTMLLGADLLTGPSGCGWAGILSEFKPAKRASLFKIPHHGAPNADDPRVWTQLLVDAPVALLTPYRGGRHPRPSKEDRARICSRTDLAFIAAQAGSPQPSRKTKASRAQLGHLAINAQDPWMRVGQVRARSRAGELGWVIELQPPARGLCEGRQKA
jgi:hypothetical protein